MRKQNDKEIQIHARYWLKKKKEKQLFLKLLHDLEVPFGFSTNWSDIVKEDSIDLNNMKSHDYHILMHHLLPILIQHVFKDQKKIQKIIISFCIFFNALCSKVIDLETLVALERSMVRTCEMEKIFLHLIFVI